MSQQQQHRPALLLPVLCLWLFSAAALDVAAAAPRAAPLRHLSPPLQLQRQQPRPPSASARALQSAVSAAAARSLRAYPSPTSYTIAGGVYDFGASDLEVCGSLALHIAAESGASLLFYPGYGLHVCNSSHGSLRGLAVEYSPPPFAQVRRERRFCCCGAQWGGLVRNGHAVQERT